MKSIRYGNADVLSDGLRLETHNPDQRLQIILATGGKLAGVVTNDRNEAMANVKVALVPDFAYRNRDELYRNVIDRCGWKIQDPGDCSRAIIASLPGKRLQTAPGRTLKFSAKLKVGERRSVSAKANRALSNSSRSREAAMRRYRRSESIFLVAFAIGCARESRSPNRPQFHCKASWCATPPVIRSPKRGSNCEADLSRQRQLTTDSDGRFYFPNLRPEPTKSPCGVTVSHQPKLVRNGRADLGFRLQLRPGQPVPEVTVRMVAAASISGRDRRQQWPAFGKRPGTSFEIDVSGRTSRADSGPAGSHQRDTETSGSTGFPPAAIL